MLLRLLNLGLACFLNMAGKEPLLTSLTIGPCLSSLKVQTLIIKIIVIGKESKLGFDDCACTGAEVIKRYANIYVNTIL